MVAEREEKYLALQWKAMSESHNEQQERWLDGHKNIWSKYSHA